MRKFIGHKMQVAALELGPITGLMVNETKSFIYIKGENEQITRIVKNKICAFTPLGDEPEEYIPFHVLYCSNEKIGCPGVKFVQEGEGIKQSDFGVFMESCPCASNECSRGTKGEIHSISGSLLKEMFANTIYGDYPEKREEEEDDTTGRTVHGQAEGDEGDASEQVTGQE